MSLEEVISQYGCKEEYFLYLDVKEIATEYAEIKLNEFKESIKARLEIEKEDLKDIRSESSNLQKVGFKNSTIELAATTAKIKLLEELVK